VSFPDWGDVLATALVGTQRRTLRPFAASTMTDPADVLLDAASTLTVYRRAGFSPRAQQPVPAPAPDDSEVPEVPSRAATRLSDLLGAESGGRPDGPVRDAEGRLELLVEWLGAVGRRRVPGELLPALLEVGRRQRVLRSLIAAAGGTRAAWLATQRDDWAYLRVERVVEEVPADAHDVWELGRIGRRVGYLTALRRRDPARARELLQGVWAGETPDDRAALLATFAVGLSTDDEEILETALDDRRKEVRVSAIELLARLPGSAYAQRMTDRVTRCVTVHVGRVRVVPPATCDKGMRRDGIAPRPPAGVGERAWWLEELLTRTPLAVWGAPTGFLALPVTEEWTPVLRRGLARAAAAQRDPGWATALTGQLTEEVAAGGRPDDRLLLEALYDALPPAALAALAVTALRRGLAGAAAIGVEHVLELCPRPWPDPLIEAVFAALDDRSGRRAAGWRLAGLCELAALRLPVSAADRAAALVVSLAGDDPMSSTVGRFAETLRYRQQMLEELV